MLTRQICRCERTQHKNRIHRLGSLETFAAASMKSRFFQLGQLCLTFGSELNDVRLRFYLVFGVN